MYAQFSTCENTLLYGLFSFFAVYTVYNGQRIIKTSEGTQSARLLWTEKNRTWLSVSTVMSALISICILFFIGINHWLVAILLIATSLISLFYVLRVNQKNLREIPFLKGHFIAFCWAGIVVAFPALNSLTASFPLSDLIAFYLLILGSSIPFDIRDLLYDRLNQKTIPQVLGVNGAKIVAVLCVTTFCWLTILEHHFLMKNVFFIISISILILLIISSNEKRSEAFYSIGIDGTLALIGTSVLIGNAF